MRVNENASALLAILKRDSGDEKLTSVLVRVR